MFGRENRSRGDQGTQGSREQHEYAKLDYYKRLGVSRTASQEEISAAFKEYTKKRHPDRHGKATEEEFKYVSEAYDVLKDPEKRAYYNLNGEFNSGYYREKDNAEQQAREQTEQKKSKAEEETRRRQAEEARRKAEAEEARKKAEAERLRKEQEERERRAREEAEKLKREQAEAERLRKEQARRQQAEAEKEKYGLARAGDRVEFRNGVNVKIKGGKVYFFDSARGVEGDDGFEDVVKDGTVVYGVRGGKKFYIDAHSGASVSKGADEIEVRNGQVYLKYNAKLNEKSGVRR